MFKTSKARDLRFTQIRNSNPFGYKCFLETRKKKKLGCKNLENPRAKTISRSKHDKATYPVINVSPHLN